MGSNSSDKLSKIEQLNQLVRASCVLMLVGVFCFAFVLATLKGELKLTAGEYIGVLSVAMTWWFATHRSSERRSSDVGGVSNGQDSSSNSSSTKS